jgi:hypothetical protein
MPTPFKEKDLRVLELLEDLIGHLRVRFFQEERSAPVPRGCPVDDEAESIALR